MFEIELFICIKMDLELNNLQWLICHKTKPNQSKPNITNNESALKKSMYLANMYDSSRVWHKVTF